MWQIRCAVSCQSKGWNHPPGTPRMLTISVLRVRTSDPTHRLKIIRDTGDGAVTFRGLWVIYYNLQYYNLSSIRSEGAKQPVGGSAVPRRQILAVDVVWAMFANRFITQGLKSRRFVPIRTFTAKAAPGTPFHLAIPVHSMKEGEKSSWYKYQVLILTFEIEINRNLKEPIFVQNNLSSTGDLMLFNREKDII